MHEVLSRTKEKLDEEVKGLSGSIKGRQDAGFDEEEDKSIFLKKKKAAEVRLIRNLDCLRHPEVKFHAERVDFESD